MNTFTVQKKLIAESPIQLLLGFCQENVFTKICCIFKKKKREKFNHSLLSFCINYTYSVENNTAQRLDKRGFLSNKHNGMTSIKIASP